MEKKMETTTEGLGIRGLGFRGIMEKKMETTIWGLGSRGIMEKKMETTI